MFSLESSLFAGYSQWIFCFLLCCVTKCFAVRLQTSICDKALTFPLTLHHLILEILIILKLSVSCTECQGTSIVLRLCPKCYLRHDMFLYIVNWNMWAFFSYYLWTVLVFINKILELMLVYHKLFLLKFLLYLIIFLHISLPHNLSYFVITMKYKKTTLVVFNMGIKLLLI